MARRVVDTPREATHAPRDTLPATEWGQMAAGDLGEIAGASPVTSSARLRVPSAGERSRG